MARKPAPRKYAEFTSTVERSWHCPECGSAEIVVPMSADENYRGRVECFCGWSGKFRDLTMTEEEERTIYDGAEYEPTDDDDEGP